ncbi:TetR/AcrR family transcriptional regulator [Streptodolium elevatio]|uniref:TetR/AcrR family transcriptional regulator n=1 Tax=Streptodolium elevatio TaxID=3157996 RepID=A0ABV3D9M3_9ACTN
MAVCAWCGEAIADDGGRGRPRDYCSRSCRAKAYRARKATAGRAPAPQTRRPPGGGRPVPVDPPDNAEGGGPHLSTERIVAAAIALADDEGLENLHMRRLAAYLGAGTMSLYRHVGGRDELVDLMVESAMGEEPQPDPVPAGWRAGLEYTARRDWGLYRRHPWILQHAMVGSRMRWTRNAALDGERALAAFDGLAVPPEEQLRLLLIVVAFTQGIALIHVNDVELTRKTGVTAQQWWDREGSHVNPELLADLPRLSSAFRKPRPFQLELDRQFEAGLKGVLDGIGALLVRYGAVLTS